MKKLSFLLVILLLFPLTQAISQQITKFAVIDTSRIYTTFYRDSRSVRDYEAKKTRYQSDIKRMSDEIKQLRQQKVDAEAASDTSRATRLERDIEKKTSFLVEYSKAKNAELDTLKSVWCPTMIFIPCCMRKYVWLPNQTDTAWCFRFMTILR